MNSTPKLQSAFPANGLDNSRSDRKSYSKAFSSSSSSHRFHNHQQNHSTSHLHQRNRRKSNAFSTPIVQVEADDSHPVIPFEIIDAASQRLYVFAFYIGLWAWRLYDFYALVIDETESMWYFLKWVILDFIFLFGLPELKIPWLEWPPFLTFLLFSAHAVLDGMLMLKTGIPFSASLISMSKFLWGRELALSDKRVNPADLLYNSSLILGKQVIHILPEGYALLNPDKRAYCIGPMSPVVEIPIQINQTKPIELEFSRYDLDTFVPEKLNIGPKDAARMYQEAVKHHKSNHHRPTDPLSLIFRIRRTGVYRLEKLLDESKLEVRPRPTHVFVVSCPNGWMKETGKHRCRGDLSNVVPEIVGIPPLRVKYQRLVNGKDTQTILHDIVPENFLSPFVKKSSSMYARGNLTDLSYAQAQKLTVPINETLSTSGDWNYSLEEIQDALENTVSFSAFDARAPAKFKELNLEHGFRVHDRPRVTLNGCDGQKPLLVAKDSTVELPVVFSGAGDATSSGFKLSYRFTPEDALLPNGEHNPSVAEVHEDALTDRLTRPSIKKPGLYTIVSVATEYCAGEVLEPASCLLLNPPKPDLNIVSEKMFDNCAENPIGLRLALELLGTPPFTIKYIEQKAASKETWLRETKVDSYKGLLELTPVVAGSYTYTFMEISDAVYHSQSLKERGLVVEQTVKPAASAHFVGQFTATACIDEALRFQVKLQGEPPWSLEYDIVYGSKRTKHRVDNVTDENFELRTNVLRSGGQYTVALTSVVDRRGCKEILNEESKVLVRHQKPKVGFGEVEGLRRARVLEGRSIFVPLRLVGDAPFTVLHRNLAEGETGQIFKTLVDSINGGILLREQGTHEIVEFHDATCRGVIDEATSKFTVRWVERPDFRIFDERQVRQEGEKYVKTEVCEGDEDYLELGFTGKPPFSLRYVEQKQATGTYTNKGNAKGKEVHSTLETTSIRMDTGTSGVHEYKFYRLNDANYDAPVDGKVIKLEQTVHPRPSAQFRKPGQTYSYCAGEEKGEEVIPVILQGVAPFSLDVEIRHSGNSKPESLTFRGINTYNYDLRVPHGTLELGNSKVLIKKVRDARGCQSMLETSGVNYPTVQISVHMAPSITALESQENYCVGERVSFVLSGKSPFTIGCELNGRTFLRNTRESMYVRIADEPGIFAVKTLKDSASNCVSYVNISKVIRPLPAVRVSKGRENIIDIHEGGEAEILFDFVQGTPPFEFTYTRSTNAKFSCVGGKCSVKKSGKGSTGKTGGNTSGKPEILETRTLISPDYSYRIKASEEGTYEVVSVKDQYCSYSKYGKSSKHGKSTGKWGSKG